MPMSTGYIKHLPPAEGISYASVAYVEEFYCLHYMSAEYKSLCWRSWQNIVALGKKKKSQALWQKSWPQGE